MVVGMFPYSFPPLHCIMSVHTTIESNIHNLNDLTHALNGKGISWKISRKSSSNVVEATINGGTVTIFQDRPGKPFVFRSYSENDIIDQYNTREFASEKGQEQFRQQKQLQKQEERRWQEDERRMLRETERARRAEEKRRAAEERESQRQIGIQLQVADALQRREAKRMREKRKTEEEQENLRQQEQRQQGLTQQAADVIRRLEEEKAAKRQERNELIDSSSEPPFSESMASVIGKLHQQNALRKILESLETLDRDTGLSLHSQEILGDETIEITLRG